MATIPAYRLPIQLERGAQFGPEFATVIQEAVSGREQRIRTWGAARGRGDIAYSLRKIVNVEEQRDYIRQVNALFLAHGGSFKPFRFRDWFDYIATDEHFGTGDGTATAWQLIKTYDPLEIMTGTPGTVYHVRNILLPVAATLTIAENGVPTTAYTLDATGIVTFTSAPAVDALLTWSGEFDLPVRFDTDHLPITMDTGRHAQIGSIPIREVIGADEITNF